VLFSQYFIQGPSVFVVNFAGQAAASEVNADGVPLTVADLVYLIRVITGDAQPITDDLLGSPKVTPHAGTLDVTTRQEAAGLQVLASSSREIGAALFVFRQNGAEVKDVVLSSRASEWTCTMRL